MLADSPEGGLIAAVVKLERVNIQMAGIHRAKAEGKAWGGKGY